MLASVRVGSGVVTSRGPTGFEGCEALDLIRQLSCHGAALGIAALKEIIERDYPTAQGKILNR